MENTVILESVEYTPKSLMESLDLSKSLTDIIFKIILYYIFDSRTSISELPNIVGLISGLGSIIFNRLAIKFRSKIKTIIRIQGFFIGAFVGGILLLRLLSGKFHDFNLTKMIAKFTLTFIYNKIRKGAKLIRKADEISRKISQVLFKLPEYDEFIEQITIDKDEMKLSAESYFRSSIVGFIAGGFLGYLLFKSKISPGTKMFDVTNILSNYKTASANLLQASILAFGSNIIEPVNVAKLKKSNTSLVKDYKSIIDGLYVINPDKTKVYFTIKQKDFTSKFVDEKIQKIKQDEVKYILQKVSQALMMLSNVDENFNKFIDIIEILQSNHDNACVSPIKNKKGKFRICIIIKPHNSFWAKLTIEEIVAILLHELGHAVTGVFTIYPLVEANIFFTILAGGATNFFVRQLNYFASIYSLSIILRTSELQADSYAIRKGFGDHLHKALSTIAPYYKWIEEEVEVNVHGNLKIRINSIKKASETFKKISKKVKEKNK